MERNNVDMGFSSSSTVSIAAIFSAAATGKALSRDLATTNERNKYKCFYCHYSSPTGVALNGWTWRNKCQEQRKALVVHPARFFVVNLKLCAASAVAGCRIILSIHRESYSKHIHRVPHGISIFRLLGFHLLHLHYKILFWVASIMPVTPFSIHSPLSSTLKIKMSFLCLPVKYQQSCDLIAHEESKWAQNNKTIPRYFVTELSKGESCAVTAVGGVPVTGWMGGWFHLCVSGTLFPSEVKSFWIDIGRILHGILHAPRIQY